MLKQKQQIFLIKTTTREMTSLQKKMLAFTIKVKYLLFKNMSYHRSKNLQ